MNSGKTVFSQLMDFLPLYEFHKCVDRYDGHYKVKSFSCWDQYLCMAFAQFTYRESLRDVQACLRAAESKLYHMGFRGKVSRNTLSHANQIRDWRIYADFAQALIAMARPLYAQEDFGVQLDQTAYALDSTLIDLCLSLFPWARFRRHKGAVKLHTLLDLRGSIPAMIYITQGRVHDVNLLDTVALEPGAIYIMDRGYLDFARLHRIHHERAFFITRAKSNLRFRRLYSHPVDKSTGVQCDQTIALQGFYVPKRLPGKAAPYPVFRPRKPQASCLLDQPLLSAGYHGCPALPLSLANRAILQVDQAASPNQGLLWHIGERREDPNLDCDLRLRAGRYRQETSEPRKKPLHNFTDFERHLIRESALVTGTFPCQSL